MNRSVAISAIVVLLCLGALFAWAFVEDEPAPLGGARDEVRTRFVNPHFVGYHKGERQWSLKAAEIEERVGEGDGALSLIGISEGLLYRDGEEYLTFQAERGVWHPEKSELLLEGNVRFYEDGEVFLTSEEVIWYGSEERLVAPRGVEVRYDDQRVEADRLEARVAEDTAELSGNVVWVTSDGLEVRAERATYADETLTFTGIVGPIQLKIGD